jgi:hypothetical protein
MDRDAAAGNVSRAVEDEAIRLVSLWRTTAFDFYAPEPGKQMICSECDATKPGRYPMSPEDSGYVCESCERRISLTEYVFGDNNHYTHKITREVGQELYRQAGITAMQAVAYRFAALGGRMSDLSRCWRGIGGWIH